MGFNFAGLVGGFSRQVVQDIEDQEKEVKLRTRTILDKQVEEVAENRKKYNEDKEKVEGLLLQVVMSIIILCIKNYLLIRD